MKFVFALDGNVVQHLAVTLLSLFEVHSGVSIDVFFILVGVSPTDVERIENLCNRFPNVTAHYLPYVMEDPDRFPITGHISLAAYARVFVAELLPADWSKVLYLDCDLIIRCSFAEIWNLDLTNWAAAGVKEPGNSRHAELEIPESLPYINSGVLLINLAYWREHRVKELLLSYIIANPEKLMFWDQDAINACLSRQILQLPDRWNVTHSFYLGPYRSLNGIKAKDLLKLQNDPAVVHFTGPTKPWMYIMTHPFQEKYWEYLGRTPFQHVKREKRTMQSFLFRQMRLLHRGAKRVLFIWYSVAAEQSWKIRHVFTKGESAV
jgi:lipopolysaccharide biosynthesis glycosyltransferase